MASVEVEHVVKYYDTADAVSLMGTFTGRRLSTT